MDKIQKIRAEIERRLNILTNVYAEQVERKDEEMMNYYHGKVIALEELRPFLDTLSEEPDKSLKEAAEEYIKNGRYLPEAFFVRPAFIAGAEWQKEQDVEEWIKDREGCFWDGVNEGKKAMYEQMKVEQIW